MDLLIQPGDGIGPILDAINSAKSRVEIMIFRFDRMELERALAKAVGRGVYVQALIAHTNRAGEVNLRKLEMRLLAAGVNVARTADDLQRYHAKMMIIDRRILYVLGFNMTTKDIDHSRSFGVITRQPKLVQEAVKLFEADTKRLPYKSTSRGLVVSPANARLELTRFIKLAKRQLLIYDLRISDPTLIQALHSRAKAGVDIRVIGKLNDGKLNDGKLNSPAPIPVRPMPEMRLHNRAMIRDGRFAFLGSMSLREMELDRRREVGIVFGDRKVVAQMLKTFEADWEKTVDVTATSPEAEVTSATRVASKVAKAMANEIGSVAPALEDILKQVEGGADIPLDAKEVERTMRRAVKDAVREVVHEKILEAVEQPEPDSAK